MATVAAEQPPASRALLAALALATLALHLAVANRYGYFRDELYYIACGRHLDWGYVDHPPLIALLAAFATRILGGSLVALRVLPALAHAGLVLVTGLLAHRFGGGRFAQGLAALAALLVPVFLGSATALNMNPFDQLLWTLCVFVLADALAQGRDPNWILFGVLAGLALLNKHSAAFFLAAAMLGLALSPQRRMLRTCGPWIAALIGLAIAVPNLWWEVRHGWPTLEFLRNAAARKNYSGSPLEFFAGQALILDPLIAPLALAGLAFLSFSRAAARFRAIGLGSIAVFILLFAMKAKNYYLAPAYPAVLAAGAVTFERFTSRSWRWLRPAYAALVLVSGVMLVPLTIPVLAPEHLVRYKAALHIAEPQSERHRPARLTQTFADMFGWEEMTAAVARIYHQLSPDEQRHAVVFASNYGEAGALEWFGRKYRLPRVVSGHNNYFLWGPPDSAIDVVITIGEDSSDVAESLESVEYAGAFSHSWNMPYESDLPIYVGRRLRMPWRVLWPNTKKYI